MMFRPRYCKNSRVSPLFGRIFPQYVNISKFSILYEKVNIAIILSFGIVEICIEPFINQHHYELAL